MFAGNSWIVVIIIGLLAGWIASMMLNRHHGILINLVIGLVGALLGFWLNANVFHVALHLPAFWSELVVAVVGSVILLVILSLFRPRRV
jgi:uncharacterized membrane protein YeaQ/YmgE (transglycosylase-associated protein family)